jgi:hypothetical protein
MTLRRGLFANTKIGISGTRRWSCWTNGMAIEPGDASTKINPIGGLGGSCCRAASAVGKTLPS